MMSTKMDYCLILASSVFLLFYIVGNWWYMSSRAKYDESTELQSERVYRAFEFYIKITIALISAIGLVALQYGSHPNSATALKMLAIINYCIMFLFVILIATHQGNKIRRWKESFSWIESIFWIETWMIIGIYTLAIIVGYFASSL